MGGRNILIIDDDTNNSQQMSDILRKEGYYVFTASSKVTAIENALKVKPSLILVKSMLVDASGYEVIRDLRSEESLQDIPVIMLTEIEKKHDDRYRSIYKIVDTVKMPVEKNDLLNKAKSVLSLNNIFEAGSNNNIGNETASQSSSTIRKGASKYTIEEIDELGEIIEQKQDSQTPETDDEEDVSLVGYINIEDEVSEDRHDFEINKDMPQNSTNKAANAKLHKEQEFIEEEITPKNHKIEQDEDIEQDEIFGTMEDKSSKNKVFITITIILIIAGAGYFLFSKDLKQDNIMSNQFTKVDKTEISKSQDTIVIPDINAPKTEQKEQDQDPKIKENKTQEDNAFNIPVVEDKKDTVKPKQDGIENAEVVEETVNKSDTEKEDYVEDKTPKSEKTAQERPAVKQKVKASKQEASKEEPTSTSAEPDKSAENKTPEKPAAQEELIAKKTDIKRKPLPKPKNKNIAVVKSPQTALQEPPKTAKPDTKDSTKPEIKTAASAKTLQATSKPSQQSLYTLQIGSFTIIENADKVMKSFKDEGFNVFYKDIKINNNTVRKVYVGKFKEKEDAAKVKQYLKDEKKIEAFIKELED
ncbi:Signal transduction response regulator, receiver region [Candidatus Magnetoovum chiemensis]|nr:Signal transduction response regulator, receiver region [Candidatus Magnetoovum chiemensis]